MEKEQLNNLLKEMSKITLLKQEVKKMTYSDLNRRREIYKTTKKQNNERYDELKAEGFENTDLEMQKLLEHNKKLDALQGELNIIEKVTKEMPLHELNRKIEVYNTRKNILEERKEELQAEGFGEGDREFDNVNEELKTIDELLYISSNLKMSLPESMVAEMPKVSTPTTPVSTPTTPISTPTTPISTPTTPISTPTTPVSTPTTPVSTPTTPVSTSKTKIKGIKIGKKIEIEYENSDVKKVKIKFKKMKKNMKKTSEQKEKDVKELLKGLKIENIDEDILDKVDPNVIYAFQDAKKNGVEDKDIEKLTLGYIYALGGSKSDQDSLKGLITYDRRGMDYWKIRTIIPKLRHGKQYQKLGEYLMHSEKFADFIMDKQSKIGKWLGLGENKGLLKAGTENEIDRNKRISEKATKGLAGKDEESKKEKQKPMKSLEIDEETKKKLEDVASKYNSKVEKEGARDMVKSDINSRIDKKISEEENRAM